MFISIFCGGEACGFGEAVGICVPGIFISIFCGDEDGEGLAPGIFIPGMFICCGEGLDVGAVLVAGMFIPGIFIPGIFPIGFLVVGRCVIRAARFFRRVCLCIPDILIPGIFMPGMFATLCFLAGFLFLVAARFFCGDDFLLIPGMFCMSSMGSAHATTNKTSIRPAIANHRDRVSLVLLNCMLPPLENQ